MRFKVTVTFQGLATLEIEAATPEAARLAAKELTVADLARAGQADILAFHAAAREIVPALSHEEAEDETAPRKPRPSGWYRPL